MKRVFLFILILLGVAPVAEARELTPQVRAMIFSPTNNVRLARNIVTIPLNGTDHSGSYKCPYMQVYVNGRGPFTFLFDTGASYTTVSSRVVEAARTPIMFDREAPDRDVVRLSNVRIGGVTLENLWALQDDSFDVDGVFGFQAFGLSNLLFDLAGRELSVSMSPFELPDGFELAYDMPFDVPLIPLQLGDRSVPTLIDTGDDAFGLEMRRDELADARLAHPPIAAGHVLNGANVQSTSITTLTERVSLGPVHADSAVVGVNDSLPVGDIGYDVLRQFRVAFDPRRRVVAFQPLFENGRFEIRGGRSPGFGLAFDGTGRITRITSESAADRAGMAAGDAILSVDGQPIGRYDRRSWDTRLESGAPLAVRWTRGGEPREAVFPVEELR
jgi:hypothetical protein